jgi:hypothetical protein
MTTSKHHHLAALSPPAAASPVRHLAEIRQIPPRMRRRLEAHWFDDLTVVS